MLLLPNYEDSSISFEGKIAFDEKKDVKLKTKITFKDVVIAESIVKVNSNNFKQSLDIISPKNDFSIKYWTHFSPSLYDIEYELIENDIVVDKVGSYFGFVKYEASKNMILQNNVQFYAKMILDQGYFNESGLTPKTEDDLLQDIKLTKELGFNEIRKHQKIEDDRFFIFVMFLGKK